MSDDRSLIGRLKAALQAARDRYAFVNHLVLMNEHYGNVQGGMLAGAVTYFGFLSFFPILALAFSVIGYVAIAYPDAKESLVTAIQQVFPGIVTVNGAGDTIGINQIANAKAAAGIVGFVGVLYSGLGWLSGLRQGLLLVFDVPPQRRPNFFVGKGIDVLMLAVLGLVLIVSVGVSGLVEGLAGRIIGWIGLSGSPLGAPLVWVIGIALGVAASTLLFFVMYRLLGKPGLASKPLWQGALLATAGFELLKVIVVNVLGGVGGSAFAPLAISITLMVWINYFSRLVMYGGSWAMASPGHQNVAQRRTDSSDADVVAADANVVAADDTYAGSRQPVAAPVTARLWSAGRGRLDARSALIGAALTAAAALVFWRHD